MHDTAVLAALSASEWMKFWVTRLKTSVCLCIESQTNCSTYTLLGKILTKMNITTATINLPNVCFHVEGNKFYMHWSHKNIRSQSFSTMFFRFNFYLFIECWYVIWGRSSLSSLLPFLSIKNCHHLSCHFFHAIHALFSRSYLILTAIGTP